MLSFVEESELRWFVSVPELFVAFYLLLVGFKIILLFIVVLSLKLWRLDCVCDLKSVNIMTL